VDAQTDGAASQRAAGKRVEPQRVAGHHAAGERVETQQPPQVAGLPVGEVARLAGVTVRTLHHYDEIGLLRPGHRTAAGYRQYGTADLLRLQRILAYRELGFGLDEVARLVDGNAGSDANTDSGDGPEACAAGLPDGGANGGANGGVNGGAGASSDGELALLARQRDLLVSRIERLRQVLAAVEMTMEARTMGIDLTPQEILEVFGDDDPTQHAEEAQQRWGDTDAYTQSQSRSRGYTKADWLQIKAEQQAAGARFATVMAGGLEPASAEAMDAAEAHRLMISTWFYDCSHAMHRELGEMHVADPRFTAYYERLAAGLAPWVRDAIRANADRALPAG
jgi:DNA-binding transcriptional MerR regulator